MAGRITIIYNGEPYNDHCHVVIGGRRLTLDSDGIILISVREGRSALERLECKDISEQHVWVKNVHFVARGRGLVTDIGDIAVTWEASGGLKAAPLLGVVGAMADAALDDGKATVVVHPPVAAVRAAFKARTGVDGRWVVARVAAPHEPLAIPVASTGSGYFCTNGRTQDNVDFCEPTAPACEQLRGRLAKLDLNACEPVPNAWCFSSRGVAHCYGVLPACDAQRGRFDSGPCFEDYGAR